MTFFILSLKERIILYLGRCPVSVIPRSVENHHPPPLWLCSVVRWSYSQPMVAMARCWPVAVMLVLVLTAGSGKAAPQQGGGANPLGFLIQGVGEYFEWPVNTWHTILPCPPFCSVHHSAECGDCSSVLSTILLCPNTVYPTLLLRPLFRLV